MNSKNIMVVLALCIGISTNTDAAMKKKSKVYMKLIEAYASKNPSADTPPETGTHFIVKWENDAAPETFFWRGDNGWLPCKTEKAHQVKSKLKNKTYKTEEAGGNIHKGDTLMLSPLTGGRYAIPEEIPATAKNTIFFKTGGSAWRSFPVTKITKK